MSRRARAACFAALALLCAGLAGSLAGSYRGGVEAQLGALRPVVAARGEIEPGRPLRPADAAKLMEVREVPERFAPADALADPIEAVGRSARAPIPAGAYVTDGLLRLPGPGPRRPAGPGPGREAVEITVAGAGALLAAGDPTGEPFDVVATGEIGVGGGGGETRLVASGVRLLALEEAAPEPGAGLGGASPWIATVAATRPESLRLIEAHNYAREVRLIGARPHGGAG